MIISVYPIGGNFPETQAIARDQISKIEQFSSMELVDFFKNFLNNTVICGVQHEYRVRFNTPILPTELCPRNKFNIVCTHPSYTGLSVAISKASRILLDTNNIQNKWYDFIDRLGAIDIATRINIAQETRELQVNIRRDISQFLAGIVVKLEQSI
ncbi:hypothetical protein H7170_01230 [Candidatus Gracilibacteria bacterium]|nr:hypothetical protein [Candidatus Gracilibacteria bacterium]